MNPLSSIRISRLVSAGTMEVLIKLDIQAEICLLCGLGPTGHPCLSLMFSFKCIFTLTNPESVILLLSPPILRRALENDRIGMGVPFC